MTLDNESIRPSPEKKCSEFLEIRSFALFFQVLSVSVLSVDKSGDAGLDV